jgi:hypothetical protein
MKVKMRIKGEGLVLTQLKSDVRSANQDPDLVLHFEVVFRELPELFVLLHESLVVGA